MKKTITISGLLAVIGIIVFFSCKKTDSVLTSKNEPSFTNVKYPMNTRLARRFYNKLTSEEGDEVTAIHSNVPTDAKPNRKHPLWSKAVEGATDSSTYVEVPLLYNKRPSDIIGHNNNKPDEQTSKVILNSAFDRLLISKNKKTGKVSVFIVSFIPDKSYAEQRKDKNLNRISQTDKDFSGYMKWRKWDGTPLYLDIVEGGKVKKRMTPYANGGQGTARKNARTATIICTTYCDYEYAQDCYTSESGGYSETWCGDWYLVGEYCWEECVDDGSGGNNGGGSGGGGGGDGWPTDLTLLIPTGTPISNMIDYLHCFNTNAPAVVNIYVDQPVANSSATHANNGNGTDVGHTFVSIEQNGIVRIFGFYPNGGVKPKINSSANSVMVDDGGHAYDVKITATVSNTELAAVIAYATSYPSTYNLNTYNCTDFGLGIATAAGLTGLADTQGTWPGGGGSNPGCFGQDIRNWTPPADATVKTTAGIAISNQGTCP